MTEWWQVIGSIIIGLGLSPAPWVTALLFGRLLPRSWHLARIKDKDDEIARIEKRHDETVKRILDEKANETERGDTERARADVERDRADAAGSRLVAVALELGNSTVKLLEGLPKLEDGEQ